MNNKHAVQWLIIMIYIFLFMELCIFIIKSFPAMNDKKNTQIYQTL